MQNTLKRGFDALIRGDFSRILRSFLKKTSVLGSSGYVVASTFRAPAWLTNVDSISLLKRTDTGEFHVAVPMDEPLEIETADPVKGVEFSILDLAAADRVRVQGTFTTESGEQFSDSLVIDTDTYFDLPRSFPVVFRLDRPVTKATLEAHADGMSKSDHGTLGRIRSWALDSDFQSASQVRFTLPSPRPDEGPPIILVSIDSVSWTEQEALRPLLDALGENASIPTEPRTQGTWTSPSHASMFSGLHPLDHGYVRSAGHVGGEIKPIHEDLTLLPELLADNGYKCSGIVSTSNLSPELGFGRGFTRFQYERMHPRKWLGRESDARTCVDRVIEWIQQDTKTPSADLFYFLQLYDPHYPYVPPLPVENLDLDAPKQYFDRYHELGDDDHPISNLGGAETIDQEKIERRWEEAFDNSVIDTLRDYHRKSITHSATQIRRLVDELKAQGLFEESLIIVTGDHGEEFGERGGHTHGSVNDAVIRPFMVVKPPRDAGWTVPDEGDTIDFLPTIATEIGAPVPSHCQGTTWQNTDKKEFRITEQFWRTNWYQVAVEKDGAKGIFSFEMEEIRRPSIQEVRDGPEYEQFYLLDQVRAGEYDTNEEDVSPELRRDIREAMEAFVSMDPLSQKFAANEQRYEPDQETIQELRDLGYK